MQQTAHCLLYANTHAGLQLSLVRRELGPKVAKGPASCRARAGRILLLIFECTQCRMRDVRPAATSEASADREELTQLPAKIINNLEQRG
jgi:hypothetical protein